MKKLNFKLNNNPVEISFNKVYVIGYSGRNMKKTQEHIDELEKELGVAPPKYIPTIFQCSKENVTQDSNLKFIGENTSGEAEYVILVQDKKLYIGLGSDHTDRKLESISVPKSKQVCLKPIADEIWEYEILKDHWDEIELKSYITIDGKETEYQVGSLKDILPVDKILNELENRAGNINNSIIFSGTVPLKDGFKFGNKFRAEMVDKKLNKKIEFSYEINVISEEEI